MTNLMKADMYRIMRGKGIYITFAVMLSIIILTVFVMRVAPIVGVSPEVVIDEFVFDDEQLMAAETMSAAIAAQMAIDSMNNIIYFFLPLLVLVSMATFSSGAVKNELTVGISRTKFYLSKWLLAVGISLAFMALFVLLHIIFALMVDGMGYWPGGAIVDMLQAFGLQALLTIGLVSVGIFFGFLTRRTSATIGLYIALALVPSLVISILMVPFPRAVEAFNYDLSGLYFHFATPSLMTNFEIGRGIIVALGYIVVATVAGIALFKRAEVK